MVMLIPLDKEVSLVALVVLPETQVRQMVLAEKEAIVFLELEDKQIPIFLLLQQMAVDMAQVEVEVLMVEVEVGLLQDLLAKGYTPLLAPIALDAEGPLNVNADTAAGAVAGALGWPAVFLTDVEGVYRDPKDPRTRFPRLTPKEVEALKGEGVIQGGMIPKVEAALSALRAGAPWAAIAKGERGVLEAVLRGEAGTRFTL